MNLSGNLKRRVLYDELFGVLKKFDSSTQREVLFNRIIETKRQFRADFFCPKLLLIVEVNGGQYVNGRHNRGGKGYEDDLTKLNIAQANGLNVLQFTYQMLERGDHFKLLENYCKNLENKELNSKFIRQ